MKRKDKRKLILGHRGTLARIAREQEVHESLVSRVLRGKAISARIEVAIDGAVERLLAQSMPTTTPGA